jgi:hypothetical protein
MFLFARGGDAFWQSAPSLGVPLAKVWKVCCENGGGISQPNSFMYCIFNDFTVVKIRVLFSGL